MRTVERLFAFLLIALMLAATLGCSLKPSTSGGGATPPETTAAQTYAAQEEDLNEVSDLFKNLFRTMTKAQTSVVCNDPMIGANLNAASVLVRDGNVLTYQATVERLNSADAEHFTTKETLDPVTGTAEEIRADYSGLFLWDRVATGLILSVPAFSSDNLASFLIYPGNQEKTLTATVPDDKLESFFGISLTGLSDMTISVVYTDAAIRSLTLAYTAGEASVSVAVTYTY